MPALETGVLRQHRVADVVEVTDRVEDLVLGELVVVAQTTCVEHARIVDNDGVVHAAAQRQPTRSHRLHILAEAEGAGARDVAFVAARPHVEAHALTGGVDRRMVEIDLETELETVARRQPGPHQALALALAHFHRFLDPQETLGRGLQHDASALQQKDKAGRRAVENGHLVGSDVDLQIVQPQAATSRHQVLDGLHLGCTSSAADRDR